MRYEYVIQSPCPKCECPIIQVACFCCSDVAHLTCRKCGHTDKIPDEDANKLMENPYVSGDFPDMVYRNVPIENWQYDPEQWWNLPFDMEKVEGEAAATFQQLREEHGYSDISGC